jgi:hypothetical protein
MARCAVSGRGVTDLATTVRGPGLFCSADGGYRLREVGVYNTTTTAFAVGVSVATAAGTPSGSPTEFCEDDPGHTVLATGSLGNSGTPTIAATIRTASVGAAIGSGVIFTFGENGVYRPEGTGNGIVLTCPTGTAQFFDFYFVFDE